MSCAQFAQTCWPPKPNRAALQILAEGCVGRCGHWCFWDVAKHKIRLKEEKQEKPTKENGKCEDPGAESDFVRRVRSRKVLPLQKVHEWHFHNGYRQVDRKFLFSHKFYSSNFELQTSSFTGVQYSCIGVIWRNRKKHKAINRTLIWRKGQNGTDHPFKPIFGSRSPMFGCSKQSVAQ